MNAEGGEIRRNSWIDAFRGLAALMVATFHMNVVPFEGKAGTLTLAWRSLWSHGHLGVPVFFALSGYCVTSSWMRLSDWRRYSYLRIRRIFPPYWSSLLLILTLACSRKLLFGVNDVATLPRSVLAVLATLALDTAPASRVVTVNWVYWTLTCEVAFYAILLVAMLSGWAKARMLVAAHAVLCTVAALNLAPNSGPLFIGKYWPLFGVGAALSLLSNHPKAGVLMLCMSSAGALLGHHYSPGPDYVIAAFATTLLIWLSRHVALPKMLQPVRRLGIFSYSLYLVHVPVGVYCLMRLLPKSYPSDAAYLFQQFLVLGGTIAASWLFFQVAEKPFITRPKAP